MIAEFENLLQNILNNMKEKIEINEWETLVEKLDEDIIKLD